MRFILLFFFIIGLVSCKDEEQEVDPVELAEVTEIAQTIEKDYNSYYSKNILELFSPTRLSMRLGSQFYDIPAAERQYVYAFLRDQFETITYETMESLDQNGRSVRLFDVHKKGFTYRANYEVLDPSGENVQDFLVLYIEKDKDDDWKLVNYYSLSAGFSYGQIFKDVFERVQDRSTEGEMLEFESMEKMKEANLLFSQERYQEAYTTLKTISPKFLKSPSVASNSIRFAMHVSDSTYIAELNNIKEITPNDQSKLYYQCLIENTKNGNVSDCIEDIYDLLILD